ncbi:hypothetical protein MGG_08658 [Pyricularia oryzae 70-15]|uniref:Uncharacterized protein n=3 Tax=Pyricularia oryzae TaxID=318829 RepID=G4MLF8_PYRO7|nr:uncharacterized protein MGG_08658 [Pyricularia oryzae 70-15]EHA58479.1 hypothetical protein MGG_08658 [Pyricularia oryzae 70-15]ELQ32576.1 hypothetical protein OOU_Y34scaffold01090g7 [Pyricularia oryzae Y34]KAI7922853.1 hypothetical protein M9X92_004675 [Pyricularia oryzae]KAI7923226.1 hypothetical protein M0657_005188 [Pyricularia oryzae]
METTRDEFGMSSRRAAKPLRAIEEKYGSPMGVIHRGDLQRILLAAVLKGGCRLFTGSNVVAVDSQFRPRVQVGDTKAAKTIWLEGDVVIPADGIKSSLRRQMVAEVGQGRKMARSSL